MALGLMNFTPETFAQANPFLTGWAAGQGIQNQQYANQILRQQVPYAGPQAAANLQQQQLANQLAQGTMQSNIQYAAGRPANLAADTQLEGAQAQQARAQAGLIGAQTPYAGITAQASMISAIARNNQYNPSAILLRLSTNKFVQDAAKNDPQIAEDLKNAAYITSQGGGNYGGIPQFVTNQNGQVQAQYPSYPGATNNATQAQPPQQPQQSQPPQQGLPMTSQQQGGAQGLNQGINIGGVTIPGNAQNIMPPQTPQSAQVQQGFQNPAPQSGPPATSQLTPQQQTVQDIQQIAQTNVDRTLLSPLQQQQINRGNSAMNIYKNILPLIPSVANYSGGAGQTQFHIDQAKAFMGIPSQQYTDYHNYLAQAEVAAKDIGVALGTHATNEQVNDLKEMVDPVKYNLTPEMTRQKIQSLMSAVHANAQAITQPLGAAVQQARNEPELQIPSLAGGSSTPPVLAKARSFKTPKELAAYYKTLSPQDQATVYYGLESRGGGS